MDARPDLGNAGTPEERRSGLGGSDAAAALGVSPWRSAYDLWEEKTGIAAPIEQTEPMLWGKLLEDVVRGEYARRTGFEVQYSPELIRHPDCPWMFVHLDGRVDNHRILEVKTARMANGWGEPETDEIPDVYLVQVHHALICTQAEVCDVAVLVGGQDFRIYRVERSAEIAQHLIEGEARFWESVTSRVPPAPVSVGDAVKRWGRFDAQGYTMAGEAEQKAVEIIKRAHQLRKQIETEEEAAKLQIMQAMGATGEKLVDQITGELLVTWKLDHGRKAYSVAAREPTRRFLVKGLNDVDV